MEAEFGRPQWQFGMSTYAFKSADRLICMLRARRRLDAGCDRHKVQALRGHSDRIHRHRPTSRRSGAGRVHRRVAFRSPRARRPRPEQRNSPGPSSLVPCFATTSAATSRSPQPIVFPDRRRRRRPTRFYYPPFSPEFAAPADEKAPVLVKSHGGPTSAASSTLSLSTQYWTSRGIGVHRRELSRQHRLRPPLPAAGSKDSGASSTSRTASRARAGWSRTGTPILRRLMISGRQRRRLYDALRAHARRRRRRSARARAITGSATSRLWRATRTNSSPVTSTG